MFATVDKMVDRFGMDELVALSDRNNAGVIDYQVVQAALASATDEMSPYLINRYELPFASVPSVLTVFACDIARYHLTGTAVLETDVVANRYKQAIQFLDKVAAGKIQLGTNALGQPVQSGSQLKGHFRSPIFNASTLKDFL